MTTLYKFKSFYTKLGVGAAPSSAPVATVVDTDTNTKLANAQATTALSNLVGYYEYEYSGADDLDLVSLFHTTDTTIDQQDLVSYVVDKVYQADKKLDGLPEDIWSSSKRTLTQSPEEIIATVFGAGITQIRGDSWAVQLTGVELGSIQQFAIKHSAKRSDSDSSALLFVDSVNGLTVLNGVAQDGEDSSKASLTYDGTILTLTVDASITAQLPAGSLKYGIQSISNNGIVSEPYGGTFRVLADIVRATECSKMGF